MRDPGDFFCSSFGVKTDNRFFIDNFVRILFESIKQDAQETAMKDIVVEATLDLEDSELEVTTLQEEIENGNRDPIIFTQLNAAKQEIRKQKKLIKIGKGQQEDENDVSKYAFILRKRLFNLPALFKKLITLIK